MAHQFGATELPVEAPGASDTLSDPALDILAAYFKAMLEKYAATAWNAVAPGEPIVNAIHTHNPSEQDIDPSEFPALYVWRQRSSHETLADDYQVDNTAFRILWLFPPAQQQHKVKHTPVLNAVSKTLRYAVHKERDPAYVNADDTDTTKTTRGSMVPRLCRFLSWKFCTAEIVDIPIDALPAGQPFPPTPGIAAELEATERLWLDPSVIGETPYTIEGTTEFSATDTDDRTLWKSG